MVTFISKVVPELVEDVLGGYWRACGGDGTVLDGLR